MRIPLFTARLLAASALLLSVLFGLATLLNAEDTNTSAVTPLEKRVEETNTDTLRSYLQLQEQLHATQLALERNRQESLEAAAKSSDLLTQRLQSIENSLAAQRARELEAMQASNRVMLIVAGSFASLGFVAMLLMVFFQWRAVNRLAEISTALPTAHALPALGQGESAIAHIGQADEANQRLLGALERLEKRIRDLEGSTRPALKPAPNALGEPPAVESQNELTSPATNGAGQATPANGSAASNHGRLTLLLAKGQSLLNGEQAPTLNSVPVTAFIEGMIGTQFVVFQLRELVDGEFNFILNGAAGEFHPRLVIVTTPAPPPLLLLASGLAGLGTLAWRRRR